MIKSSLKVSTNLTPTGEGSSIYDSTPVITISISYNSKKNYNLFATSVFPEITIQDIEAFKVN